MVSLHHLSDEIILRILDHLAPRDLARLSAVDRHLARLAADPQIWKRLFIRYFIDDPGAVTSNGPKRIPSSGRLPTLSSLRAFINNGCQSHRQTHKESAASSAMSSGLRRTAVLPHEYSDLPVAVPHLSTTSSSKRLDGLPSRYRPSRMTISSSVLAPFEDQEIESQKDRDDDLRHDDLDWLALFKVQHNWQIGQFLVERLATKANTLVGAPTSADLTAKDQPESPSGRIHVLEPSRPDTLVQASRQSNLIFTASRSAAHANNIPTVQIFHSTPSRSLPADTNAVRTHASLAHSTPLCSLQPDKDTCDALRAASPTLSITEVRLDDAPCAQEKTVNGTCGDSGSSLSNLKSTPSERLLVCYNTGAWIVYRVCEARSSQRSHLSIVRSVQEYAYIPALGDSGRNEDVGGDARSNSAKAQQVAVAAFHSPLLCTVTTDFTIRLYALEPLPPTKDDSQHHHMHRENTVKFLQELRTFSCHWPASVRLAPVPHLRQQLPTGALRRFGFRLTVVFSTPSYPSTWSVGLQEVLLLLTQMPSDSRSASAFGTPIVTSRSTTAAAPYIRTPIDALRRSILPRPPSCSSLNTTSPLSERPGLAEQSAGTRADKKIVSITNDDSPFVVVGRADNLLEIFEVEGAAAAIDPSGGPLSRSTLEPVYSNFSSMPLEDEHMGAQKTFRLPPATGPLILRHQQVMYGHTGAVSSVALEDGRCVSGATDGCVMVWSVGGGQGPQSGHAERHAEDQSQHRLARKRARDQHSERSEEEVNEEAALDRIFGIPLTPKRRRPHGDVAGDKVAHLLTLRTPPERADAASLNSFCGKGKERSANDESSSPTFTELPESPRYRDQRILQHLPNELDFGDLECSRDQSPAIRWVGTGFDRIVSVSVSSPLRRRRCGMECRLDGRGDGDGEAVQVWSFAG